MDIIERGRYLQEDLLDVMRRTALRGFPGVLPFADSKIYTAECAKGDLLPCQFYMMRPQLDKVAEIVAHFRAERAGMGIDLLHNDGFVVYESDGREYAFTPPIVEIVDGEPLLIDGIHRTIFAGKRKFTAVFVENVPPEYYHYALPNDNGWNDVSMLDGDVLPEGFARKKLRYPMESYKKWFREYPFPAATNIKRAHDAALTASPPRRTGGKAPAPRPSLVSVLAACTIPRHR
ncbi:MAG: hypothetical protein LBI17_00145 [Rickettsiales bacterium]|jgi:hypothetical protein|nr:hypothetical protein [Rickettsiales bacterium]